MYNYRPETQPTRTTAPTASDPMPPSGDKFERFEAWLLENGAQFPALELREYNTSKSFSSLNSTDQVDEEEKKEPTKEGVEAQEESEMRGVHAKTHIPPNTVCMIVPRKCLITVEMGQATPIGQAIFHSDLDLDAPKHIYLMVFLLWDRKVNGSASFFHPYYEILPRTLKNMPVFWSREELAYLEGSYLLEQISDRNDAIAEDYFAICRVAPELAEICNLDDFKWARMCVCSRNFGLQIDGHRTSALVPHADMLNHFRPRETKWTFDDERQGFTITTLQSIPVGAQVYDSYGQKCNHRFLLNYGFAVEDNHELDGFCPNEVPVELGLLRNDPLHDLKMEFWTRSDGSSLGSYDSNIYGPPGMAKAQGVKTSRRMPAPSVTRGQLTSSSTTAISSTNNITGSAVSNTSTPPVKRVRICVSNNESTRLLFSLLRTLACNEPELRAIAMPATGDVVGVNRSLLSLADHRSFKPGAGGAYYRSCRDIRHPISLRNEQAAMRILIEVIDRALAMYPTTLSQDVSDLLDERNYPRFSNKRHAKIQVKGEKEVLHHFMQWGRTALDVLGVIERELSEALRIGGHPGKYESPNKVSFDEMIHQMEEDEDFAGLHHTIVRHCADVLGSLRREELKNVRKQKGQH
mmetsp:Transcript_7782/g.11167  ORF Transcript_7782/g.11167 Transcript_7782/m.11167 type:complete len:635 (+) Transcript_7782:53-1957(+)